MLRVGYHSCGRQGLGGGEGRTKGLGLVSYLQSQTPGLETHRPVTQVSNGLQIHRARWSQADSPPFFFLSVPEFSGLCLLTKNQENSYSFAPGALQYPTWSPYSLASSLHSVCCP